MKKLFTFSAQFVLLVLAFTSCIQDESVNKTLNEPESISEIELMEKETGVVFYKEDIKLAHGSNEVVIRVASKDETMLKNYLKDFEFSITPLFAKDINFSKQSTNRSEQAGETSSEIITDGIFTEFISQKLDDGVVGFRTNVKVLNEDLKNGRISANGYPNQAIHTSGNWPELFEIFAYQTVRYDFDGKTKWYSGWSSRTFCQWANLANCQSYWEQPSHNVIYIDGPYRVRAVVDYYNFVDYSFQFINL
jgi:hypothetical protein